MLMLRQKFKFSLEKIVEICRDIYADNLVTVAVFGSVGRDTPNPYSDIDLLIVVDNLPVGRLKRVFQFAAVEEQFEPWLKQMKEEGVYTSLSPVIKTPGEINRGSLLFLDMTVDALILYDRDDFFHNYLAELRKRLQELGAYKLQHGERWHWVLKPDYQVGDVFEI